MNFAEYSRFYDLLYQDKDYQSEADYILGLLNRFAPNANYCLEVGSGTGRHALLLAEKGWNLVGIERSEDMLREAKKRAVESSEVNGSVLFQQGDARSFEVSQMFPAAISLFHVVSYMTSNDDVDQMFGQVSKHLQPNGIFIFDLWYTPAVYNFRPAVRVKRVQDSEISIVRLCEPEERVNENVVLVNYELFIENKVTGEQKIIREQHPMRHYSQPEISRIASQFGLTIEHAEEWITGKAPSEKTWGVCFVARKL